MSGTQGFVYRILMDAFIPLALCCMVVLIVIFIIHRYHSARMELIRRGINPMKYRVRVPGQGMIGWGIVLLGLGLGGIAATIVTRNMIFQIIMLSVAFALAGIGFIIYWKISAPERDHALKLKERLLFSPEPGIKSDAKLPEEQVPGQ
jgi:hypothetical protein